MAVSLTNSLNVPTFSRSSMAKIGHKIWMNETSGKKEYLVFWNPKEPEFLSGGIGHFVWPSSNCSISFLKDTFSDFLAYCTAKGVILPSWLQKNQKCPWRDRADFIRSDSYTESRDMQKVRNFLHFHKRIQTEFILVNFLKSLPQVIENLPKEALEYCNFLLASPKGCFALIDYNHFKGQGLHLSAAYNNQAWGLKQVLERALQKDWKSSPLEVFIESAKETLQNRVDNAPAIQREIEKSFIPGWFNRLDNYKNWEK